MDDERQRIISGSQRKTHLEARRQGQDGRAPHDFGAALDESYFVIAKVGFACVAVRVKQSVPIVDP